MGRAIGSGWRGPPNFREWGGPTSHRLPPFQLLVESASMPLCQTGPRITPTSAEARAQRYRRLAVAETDASRAKILWQLVEDALRNALCTSHCDDTVRRRTDKDV